MAVHEFVYKVQELLDKEREAEITENQCLIERLSAKELERKGVCLLKLVLKSRHSGLYGRMVAVFEPVQKPGQKNAKPELRSHDLSPGDIVGVALMKSLSTDKPLASGIVSVVTASHIDVAFDEGQDIFELDDDELYKLTKLANDVTYRRLKRTLTELDKYEGGPAQKLIDIFFFQQEVSPSSGEFPIRFNNESLDESQQEAVRFALNQRELAIIHGPPGTGKTTTVIEIILQAVRQGLKVLATAPSNVAVDNLVERLAATKQRIVRIGHPARLLSHLQKFSLDAIVSASEEKGLAKDVRVDQQKVLAKMKKARGGGERHALREELKALRKELSQREEAATRHVLSQAQVILVTLTSASPEGPLKLLKEDHFDLVIIDECSQALEVACWMGLLKASKCVLAGDHLQLPPTILSREAATAGLEITLMERLLKKLVEEKGHDVMRMLTVQYRMHTAIMQWASEELYQGQLQAHPSVASHLLRDLKDVVDQPMTNIALLLIDTAGCDLWELDLPEEVSKANQGEADIVCSHVEDLIKAGVQPVDIAVIAPYNLQVDMLRLQLSPRYPELEIKSVDGFQGREKEAVVLCLVRSNTQGEVGFLGEKRRINVAVTRARRHVAVVCDSDTVCHDKFLKSLIDYINEHGEVLSAHMFMTEIHQNSAPAPRQTCEFESSRSAREKGSKHKHPGAPPNFLRKKELMSKEEKEKQFEAMLLSFLSDPSVTTLDFPATLTSHDRLVIHEVASRLELVHASCGEGKERHIQVSKPLQEEYTIEENRASLDTEETSSPESAEEVTNVGHKIKKEETGGTRSVVTCTEGVKSLSEDKRGNRQEAVVTVSDSYSNSIQEEQDKEEKAELGVLSEPAEPHDGSAYLSEESNALLERGPVVRPSYCQHCGTEISQANLMLHELHCGKRKTTVPATTNVPHGVLGEGAKKKEGNRKDKKKQKDKHQVSHVQKASDVLEKIDKDDFDSLINKITELDSKCAFKKCKTLTNTLGRHCEFCTRRFCLSHLMPEVHGCGQAAKDAARRLISKEGVLYSGSAVPSKKPSATRRAQLEARLEKKKEELSGKRARNSDKKKS